MEERKCNFFSLQSGMTQRCLHNFLLIFIPNERFSINRKRWLDAGKIKILYKIGNMRKKKNRSGANAMRSVHPRWWWERGSPKGTSEISRRRNSFLFS